MTGTSADMNSITGAEGHQPDVKDLNGDITGTSWDATYSKGDMTGSFGDQQGQQPDDDLSGPGCTTDCNDDMVGVNGDMGEPDFPGRRRAATPTRRVEDEGPTRRMVVRRLEDGENRVDDQQGQGDETDLA